MKKQLNILLVGFGYWGKNFYRIIEDKSSFFNLVGIVDENFIYENNESIQNYPVLNNVYDAIDILDNIDCAIVATPTTTHYEITKVLLNNNIHCLVEKPLTTSYSEAKELYDLAESNKLKLLVDHTFLYDQSILELKKIIENNELGDLLHLSFERTNLGPVRTDTNAAWDLSTHDLSILFALIDDTPIKVEANGLALLNKANEDIVNISLEFENIFVTLFSSWLHPEKSRIIKVVGDKKMAVWNGLLPDQELKIMDKGVEKENNISDYKINMFKVKSGIITIPNIIRSEPLMNVVLDFYKLIINNEFNVVNSKELTLKIIETMEKISLSLNK